MLVWQTVCQLSVELKRRSGLEAIQIVSVPNNLTGPFGKVWGNVGSAYGRV